MGWYRGRIIFGASAEQDLVQAKIWCERRRLSYHRKKTVGARGGKDFCGGKKIFGASEEKRFGARIKSYNTRREKSWCAKKILYGVRKRFVATEGKDLVWCKDKIGWFKQRKSIGERLMSNPDCFWVGN